MNNETMDINKIMDEKDKTLDLKPPSEEKLRKEMDDKIYSDTVKNKLAALRKTQFTGTSEQGDSSDEFDATCTVKMTSQYQAEEVSINPNALRKTLSEAQVNTQDIEIDQLVHICVTLGEATRLAFNNAREKTHKGSEAVFNHLMEEMQTELFGQSDDK